MTLAPPIAAAETVAELLERLGNIPPDRVRLVPATEADVPGAAKPTAGLNPSLR